MPENEYKIICNAEIVKNNGRDALMIRKFLQKKSEINIVVDSILNKGSFKFEGELIFLNVEKAIKRLKVVGLY